VTEHNGVEGTWVPIALDDVKKGDIVRFAGTWTSEEDYADGEFDGVKANDLDVIEKFVKDEKVGTIRQVRGTDGGIYIRTYKGWQYVSVMSATLDDPITDEDLEFMAAYPILREGNGD
jgi:hypothetical protein